MPPPPALAPVLASALDAPLGPALSAPPGARVTVIVSDPTRAEPRAAFIAAVRERLPAGLHWTLAIATGTHGPCEVPRLGLPERLVADMTLVNHDGHSGDNLVELGATARGTPVRVHRCLTESDLVIATGCIRPHYFAGFGAGAKALFPGLGEACAIRLNHRLKIEGGARAGIVVSNPCRTDLEEAARMIGAHSFLLNGVLGPDGAIHAAVAGDLVGAFRVGAELARPWFTVRAPRASLVIASDALPVSASLYQAAKIAAAAAPLVVPGGMLAVVAECGDGIEPLDVVNNAIFQTGVLPRLAPGVRLLLVSSLSAEQTALTRLAYAASVESILDQHRADHGADASFLVVPRASQVIAEPAS
jgi:lactate racemase